MKISELSESEYQFIKRIIANSINEVVNRKQREYVEHALDRHKDTELLAGDKLQLNTSFVIEWDEIVQALEQKHKMGVEVANEVSKL